MIHNQVEKALVKALRKRYPRASIGTQTETYSGTRVDLVLGIEGKKIGFEVKMSNFYDALGRSVLWAKEFNGVYLVVPTNAVPSRKALSRMPLEIGVIVFTVQNRVIEFHVARPSRGCQLQEFNAPIRIEAPLHIQPVEHTKTSLVSPKALRVIRHLIAHRETAQIQIVREAQVSAGMVNKVIAALVDRELVSYRGKRLVVFDVWRLLNEVSWNRPLRRLRSGEIVDPDAKSIEDVEAKLAETCNQTKTRYALTLFSGASRYIGYGMKYDSVQAYVEEPALILERLAQTRPKGGERAVLEVFTPDSLDIIGEAKPVGTRVVCSPTQLVLDLVSSGQMGRDWAVKLYEAVIAKKE